MNKKLYTLAVAIGSTAGAYLPVWLFHAGDFSATSILFGVLGGIAGIYVVYKFID
jgi:hypothetical protein